ncbi:hypothetical protein RDI58_013638 [Solanum bulbocastanum]|uniref:Uncharacterized protein n=1 Tax=Solanum bulbocastanum TaxID=147425 RepID=A0AAN8YHY2_SOLBU
MTYLDVGDKSTTKRELVESQLAKAILSLKLVYLAIGSGVAAMLRGEDDKVHSNVYKRIWYCVQGVASFTGDKQALEEYSKSLQNACRSGIHESTCKWLRHWIVPIYSLLQLLCFGFVGRIKKGTSTMTPGHDKSSKVAAGQKEGKKKRNDPEHAIRVLV